LSRPLKAPKNAGLSMSAPTRSAKRSGCSMGSPSTVPVPPLGAISPSNILIVVDLPDPFGPTKPVTPPEGTSKVKPSTATKSPNLRVRPLVVSAAIPPLACASNRPPSRRDASHAHRYALSFVSGCEGGLRPATASHVVIDRRPDRRPAGPVDRQEARSQRQTTVTGHPIRGEDG
jgi:hypothetical protein